MKNEMRNEMKKKYINQIFNIYIPLLFHYPLILFS